MGKKKADGSRVPQPKLYPTNYYVLNDYGIPDCAVLTTTPDLEPHLDNWMDGEEITEAVPEPLLYTIDEDESGNMPAFFLDAMPLMEKKLLKILEDLGVDNLQTYQAEIHDEGRKKVFKNYRAINIVGAVAMLDKKKSKSRGLGLGGAGFIHKLVLDESKAKGKLILRLEESLLTILVHKKIKDAAEKNGIKNVSFTHPALWSG